MNRLVLPSGRWPRVAAIVLWVVLVALLVQREVMVTTLIPGEEQLLEQAAREEYQSIYFRNDKVGYVVSQYQPREDGGVDIDQLARMNLNVAETIHAIDLHLVAQLHSDSTLQNFTFRFTSPFYQMTAQGEMRGDRLEFTLTTGSNTITDSLQVSSPPLVPTVRRGYLLNRDLQTGDRLKVPWFDPVSLTAKESLVEYRGREKVQIGGRVHELHTFVENYGGARISLWLNDEGEVIKEESPAGFVFIKEPKFRALELGEPAEELLAAVAVPVIGEMGDIATRNRIRYRLTLPEGVDFDLDRGRQHFVGEVLTVFLESLPSERQPEAMCPDLGDSLAATPYVQAKADKVAELVAQLLPADVAPLARVRTLADWVYTNLEKRPVLGIPDALTTLENRVGDCNEHAALFAALARNSGVPARIAAGVVFHQGAFYYHAWNEVCVGESWLSVDTTTGQLPADVSHIKFVEGEMAEQMRIGALLGRLAIEVLPEAPEEGK